MRIEILSADAHVVDLRTRMPFRYGIATMIDTPHVFVRVAAVIDGRPSGGIAADHLPPKWFTKDPDAAMADEVVDMLRVVRRAVGAAAGVTGETPFEVCREIDAGQTAWGRGERVPPLLSQFGSSLVERALLEAVCRAAGEPFSAMLYTNRFGIRLGDMHGELAGFEPADLLPAFPRSTVIARHTVGLTDPLVDDDLKPEDRLNDGLPQSLAACIERYGLRQFKIKLSGDVRADAERLARIAAIAADRRGDEYAVSVDGNERFTSLDEFRGYWRRLGEDADCKPILRHLMYVEQPLHRDVALDPAAFESTASVSSDAASVPSDAGIAELPPLIIDESDAEMSSLPQALRLGYAGSSHKNCKGVLHSVANACLLAKRRREAPECTWVNSGEDLVNIGPVALLQDLAVAAALGIESIERNGHHYFAGLSMFDPAIQSAILASHDDLYERSPHGWPTLRIVEGRLALGTVNAAPMGVWPVIDVEQFIPADEYVPPAFE